MSLLEDGRIRYELKTPYRDGTTHVIFEPLDFLARLAALVPKPRVNLTRFHGVFAPNSKHRIQVTPAKRGKGSKQRVGEEGQCPLPTERRAAMTWAQRLKRVFNIDIETCPKCGGAVKIIACIEDPVVIDKILTHLDKKAALNEPPNFTPFSFALAIPSACRSVRRSFSNSAIEGYSVYAFRFSFSSGDDIVSSKTNRKGVWLVRGGQ